MIYQKRGTWRFRDETGKQHKFSSEIEAKLAYGKLNAPKEESFEEETCTDEQEIVFESEGGSEEEV